MDPVILMVGRVNEGVHDVEVMPDIPAAELADALAHAFGWTGVYEIQVAGKILAAHQTLADADLWDGAHLTLVASSRPPHPVAAAGHPLQVPDQTAQGLDGPVVGKRTLKVPATTQGDNTTSTKSWEPVLPQSPAPTSPDSPVTGWRQPSIPPDKSSSTDHQKS